MENSSGLFSPEKNVAVTCLLLVAATLAVYNPVADCGFVYSDDVAYITENPAVRAGLTWTTVVWAFSGIHAGFYHPLTFLSHALDCQLFGLKAAGHHYVSLLLHAANGVLLFLVLLEATGAGWPSLAVAVLFALHPQNVESVAWAAERKTVLSMFFFLLALWSYGRYASSRAFRHYLTVALLFSLGLMCKPQIITLPFVLLLWDYWPLGRMFASRSDFASGCGARSLASLVPEKIPLFVIAALWSVITVVAQRQGAALRSLAEYSLSSRLGNSLVSYVRYVFHTFWPVRLAPLYPHSGTPALAQTLAASALLFLLTAMAIWRRNQRYLLVGWLWFLGTLVPMIGIVQVGEQAMADRFAYIPMIGLFLSLVWLIAETVAAKPMARAWVAIPASFLLVGLGLLTYRQLSYWHDGETLWRYTLRVNDHNYLAHANLAMTLAKEGKPDEAIQEFHASEKLHAYPPDQLLKIGLYEQRNGHLQDAIEEYQKVSADSSDRQLRAAAWSQKASAYVQMADYDQARRNYENALQQNPKDVPSLVGTAMLAARQRDFSQAAARLSQAMKLDPTDVGFLLLADALRHAGRLEDAHAAEATAQKISANLAQARQNATATQLFFGYKPA